jgi:hypothetical protein
MKRWCVQLRQMLLLPLPALLLVFAGLAEAAAQPSPADFDMFKSRITDAVHALGNHPRLKSLSPMRRQQLAEFVSGNMLFVLLHELAHATISELELPVLGKEEDAADSFASLTLINIKSQFSERVLAEAAKGWFMADRRDAKEGEMELYYDEHGLNQQRAYQIVCFMVGSDEDKFKNLAAETKLPEERQDTCAGDYSNAAYSWAVMLKPHRRTPDQPKAQIDVVYGAAQGRLEIAAQVARSVQLLEVVAAGAAEELAWPAPFALEMQTCDFPNARWDLSTHKLTLCYELVAEFEDLYRDYGDVRADGSTVAYSAKRKSTSLPAAFKASQTPRKRK